MSSTVSVPAGMMLCALLMSSCSPGPVDPAAHRAEIEQWQARRVTGLQRSDGWLTLVGLSWLSEGANSCGADSSSNVLLPKERAPGRLGTFVLKGGEVSFTSAPGQMVTSDSKQISSVLLRNDNHSDGPTLLRHGSLILYVIKRADDLGVRIKDTLSETRMNFQGLSFFPISLDWRFEAEYVPFPEPKALEIPALAGPPQKFTFPGLIRFSVKGVEYTLDAAYEEGMEENLFFMFGDETNGLETYGAGRQLYTDLPDSDNKVIVDFNRAYNWPCVFTEYATCPLPPVANVLKLRVEAGERLPPAKHNQESAP